MADETSNLPEVATRAVLDRIFRQALIQNIDQTLAIAQLFKISKLDSGQNHHR
jgi:hypothetical protein